MAYIEIAEWDRFQHYKLRNPPWIKLYSKLLDDDTFDCLQDDSKLLFFCLLLFASRKKNHINLNFGWLQKKLPIEKKITTNTLQPLVDAGFITCYNDDSTVIASCKQNAIPEKRQRRVEESREEKKKYLEFVSLTDDEHKKLIQRYGEKPVDKIIRALNRYIGQSGKKYKSHYFTLLNFAKRDELPELSTPKTEQEREAGEKAGREKKQQKIRDEEGRYYREKTTDELNKIMADPKSIPRRWLIKEILKERSSN